MTINCKGNLIDLSSPKVMGILNVTPDSFFDGGSYKNEKDILVKVENMLGEGATFIDLGGYSSRPGADHIPEAEELDRVLPAIKAILGHFPETLISIDTFRSNVARASIEEGAAMINDISAGKLDELMLPTVAELQVPYIMMHMKGTPQNMRELTDYEDMILEINSYFSERIHKARSLGIKDLIFDPGFGFSKTLEQNYELLSKLEIIREITGLPFLAGVSRKSMIFKLLATDANQSLNGTTCLNTVALMKGASILRVHDVKEAMECIKITNQLVS